MFIAGKILFFFLSPFVWVFILVILTALARTENKRKKLGGTALAVLLFFSNPWLINNLQYPFHAPPMPMAANEKYDIGIVLGGMTSYDRVNKQGHFNMSSDRFIQTALLYKKGYIKKIIASGGQNGMFSDDDFMEADFVAKNLIDLGIPAKDIWIENQSKNTLENAQFSKQIIDRNGGIKTKAVLITSAFHIPRATLSFEQAGISVRPYPCAFSMLPSATRFSIATMIPASWAMENWGGFFKEMIGMTYLKLKGTKQ
jgi:uncharacterized SAM-binding protein YcdF (DUF218 family)